MDIDNLTLDQLEELQRNVAKEIKKRMDGNKSRVLGELRALAKSQGFVLEDLLSGNNSAAPRKAVAVKYRHPEDNGLTWTGRGRMPKWVADWQSTHNSLDGIRI